MRGKQMTIPCGETIGHGETCSSGWLCENCQEKSQAAQEERARIVAWLRAQGEFGSERAQAWGETFAMHIEAGEHLK